jgi:hypothetical protein
MTGDWSINVGRLWTTGATISVMGALGAAVVWFIATQLFDETLMVQMGSGGDAQELNLGLVLGFAFFMGLLATGVLHLLLVFVPRGQVYFATIGTLVLLLSFVPIAQLDMPTANKLWLGIIHITVYAFVVPGLTGAVSRVATLKPETPAET